MEVSDRFCALNEGRLSAPRPARGLSMEEIGLMLGGAHDMHDFGPAARRPRNDRAGKAPDTVPLLGRATPVLAVLLTMVAGGIMFAALGKDPFEAIRIIFWDPLFSAVLQLLAPAAADQGGAADPDRHRPFARFQGRHLEHRGGGAIHHRRDLRGGFGLAFYPSKAR
jgi:hypothetical protein